MTDSQAPAPKNYGHPEGRRSPRELLAHAKDFAVETPTRSWFHVAETFAVLLVCLALTIVLPQWWARLAVSIFFGLVIVRGFILYHDYMHGAILKGSSVGKWLMYAYGVAVLTPPNVWRQTHNYHHAHTAKIVGSNVGSYLMLTTDMYKQLTPREQWMYRAVRHPITIFFAYFTVFLFGMCVSSFQRQPKKNWDSMLSVVIHVAAWPLLIIFAGFDVFLFAYFIPVFVATMAGAYLFYAQHNFPDMNVQPRETWEYSRAAMESSSYMKTGPVMQWLTGNIGYHHVHHLNPTIPFYRLPEAMKGIPELQQPLGTTGLAPRDIVACFRQKLWDPATGRMVGYPET